MPEIIAGLMVLLVTVGFIFFIGFVWWRIYSKTGFHGALGLLMFIPGVNFIMLIVLAFMEWPIHRTIKEEAAEEGAAAPTKTKSKSLPAVVIITIALVAMIPMAALLAAIAIPNLLRAKISANDALAAATLRDVSTAAETYATANSGRYPSSMDDLLYAHPPYINLNYCGQVEAGYEFSCYFSPEGYEVVAAPTSMGSSGSSVIRIREGGVMEELEGRPGREEYGY